MPADQRRASIIAATRPLLAEHGLRAAVDATNSGRRAAYARSRDILLRALPGIGLDRIAQHALRQRQNARQLARDERLRRRRVALPHAPHQILVGVDDRDQTCLFRC